MSSTPPAVEVVSHESKSVLCLRGSLGVADASALRDAAVKFASADQTFDRGPGCGRGARPKITIDINADPLGVDLLSADLLDVDPLSLDLFSVDLREVDSLDVSVLQILAALDAELSRRGRPLKVHGPTETLRSQWEAAGWRGFTRLGGGCEVLPGARVPTGAAGENPQESAEG